MSPDGELAYLAPDAPDRDATIRRSVKICNQKGLHARAAARFVKTAAQFQAEVWVRKNGTAVSGRSIMGLMMLAAGPGSTLHMTATGPQGPEALQALIALVEDGFGEDCIEDA